MFVDPGTYLYHSGGKWRKYFRSTAAHNTIRINETDLTDMPGDFMFGKPYKILDHSLKTKGYTVTWRAEHDAYHRLVEPVKLNRAVTWDAEAHELQLVDEVSPEGECLVELFFHLHPDCKVSVSKSIVSLNNQDV